MTVVDPQDKSDSLPAPEDFFWVGAYKIKDYYGGGGGAIQIYTCCFSTTAQANFHGI